MTARELITEHLDLWTGAVTKKSSSGRGSNGKVELTGVKKLRELILELALSGKLVEAEENDQSAHQLLSKIESEKARLAAEKIIKTPKKLEAASGDEPYQIPSHWCWVRLGQVTNYGVTDKAEPNQVADNTWVLELEDIEKESSRLLNKVHYTERQFKSSKNRFERGDVLYGKLRPYLDKVLVADGPGVCTTEIIPIRGYFGLSPEFLRLVLKSPNFKRYANDSTHGMNLPRLGTDKARLAMIPLAPEQEQHGIVQKFDELMALCDRLEQQTSDQLEAHETLVDTLLGSLLRNAEGSLTQSENATELADNWARLATHFDTLFTSEQSIDKLKQTILQLATAGELVPFQGAPVPLKNVLSFGPRNGFSPKESNYETGCKVLKLGATTKGWLDLLESKNVDIGNSVPQHLWLKKGDILIQRGNAANHVGCNVLLDSDFPNYIYPDLMMKVRVKEEVAIPSFVALYLSAPGARQFMWERMTGTSGTMPKISKKVVEEIPLSLPDTETQKAVVQIVDELMALCDQLKERLNKASETRCHLAEAVVEGALT